MAPKAAPAPAPTGGEAEGVRPTVESVAASRDALCPFLPLAALSTAHHRSEPRTEAHMASTETHPCRRARGGSA